MIQPRAARPDPYPGEPFHGSKLFLTHGDRMLTCLRDDYAHIPYPNHWDLPGGGREADESPAACALRELHEEFGLTLPASRLHGRSFPSHQAPGMTSWLFSGVLDLQEIAAIRFGDEGQEWRMMPVEQFIAHPRAVPHFRERVKMLWQPSHRGSTDAPWL